MEYESIKLIIALIMEYEVETFEQTVTIAKELEQITADAEYFIPERSGERLPQQKEQ